MINSGKIKSLLFKDELGTQVEMLSDLFFMMQTTNSGKYSTTLKVMLPIDAEENLISSQEKIWNQIG